MQSVRNTSFLPLLHVHSLSCFYMGSLPQDAILPTLIHLHRLATGCSSPSMAPTWDRTTGPTLQALRHSGPHGQQFPQTSYPTWTAPAGGVHGLYFLQTLSTAALWLYLEICSTWCPWATGGQFAPPYPSPGLWRSSALGLEHLLLSFCATELFILHFSLLSLSC